jgi:hypothetical protein
MGPGSYTCGIEVIPPALRSPSRHAPAAWCSPITRRGGGGAESPRLVTKANKCEDQISLIERLTKRQPPSSLASAA